MPIALGVIAVGLLGVAGAVSVIVGEQRRPPPAAGYVGVVLMLGLVALGVLALVATYKARRARALFDARGFWWDNGRARALVPWEALSGVAVHWSRLGRGTTLWSLELYPHGPVDRDDPALWPLVRDTDPPEPGLPRVHYQLPFRAGAREPIMAAVRQHAPALWLGEVRRPPGHIGRANRRGRRAGAPRTGRPESGQQPGGPGA
ncbi:hypothetical protein SAMN05421806_102568 [Streptomyces indicus]|uniref:PH domain-containing protein n=1 Tax=Streptomyces indicus TaxID=417292 RepID=A0A1G8WMX3_9ACTN|nr:hypothetical protein SAMN05421806_102568 [Streptomyces indicus]